MQCKHCGREITNPGTGKRAREYCNAACKQAAYRQRQQEPVVALRGELRAALRHIQRLEHAMQLAGVALPDDKPVEPVLRRD